MKGKMLKANVYFALHINFAKLNIFFQQLLTFLKYWELNKTHSFLNIIYCSHSSVIASKAERMFRTGTISILIFISFDKDL